MTREAEDAPLDNAIDEIARAMTPRDIPDLRARVAARMDRPAPRFVRWQPALACVALLVALAGLWMMLPPLRPDDVASEIRHVAPTRPPDRVQPTVAEPSVAQTSRPRHPRVPSRRRDVVDEWPSPAHALPPLVLDPLHVDPVPPIVTAPEPIADTSALAVEELHVEPLPRSNQ